MKQWAVPALGISLTLGWVLAIVATRDPGPPPSIEVTQEPLRTRLARGLYTICVFSFLPGCDHIRTSNDLRPRRTLWTDLTIDEETGVVRLSGKFTTTDPPDGDYFKGGVNTEHLLFEDSKSQVLEGYRMNGRTPVTRQRNQLLLNGYYGSLWLRRIWHIDDEFCRATLRSQIARYPGRGDGYGEELPLRQSVIAEIPRVDPELIGLTEIIHEAEGIQVYTVNYNPDGVAEWLNCHFESFDKSLEASVAMRDRRHCWYTSNLRVDGRATHIGYEFPPELVVGDDGLREPIAWIEARPSRTQDPTERHLFLVYGDGLEVIHAWREFDSGLNIESLEFRRLELDPLFDRMTR